MKEPTIVVLGNVGLSDRCLCTWVRDYREIIALLFTTAGRLGASGTPPRSHNQRPNYIDGVQLVSATRW